MKRKEVIIMRMKGYTTYFIVINVLFHYNPMCLFVGRLCVSNHAFKR